MSVDEHELIARYFRPLATHAGALGLQDDAAFITPQQGCDLVLTKDAIAEGVHYLPGEGAADIARKAVRVNLSDLAAKGADPLGYLLCLGLPEGWTEDWLAEFTAGLAEDQAEFGIALLGGDTIRAAGTTISVTAIGTLPSGRMVRRSGARAGDLVYVTGTIGDGALGLLAARGEKLMLSLSRTAREALLARYRRPQPRTALAAAIRDHASAALDVSDGLAGDLDKLCAASGVSARVELDRVPLSDAAREALSLDEALLEACVTGGDDYEILCTVPQPLADDFEAAAEAAGTAVTRIGEIVAGGEGVDFLDNEGHSRSFARRAFSHTG